MARSLLLCLALAATLAGPVRAADAKAQAQAQAILDQGSALFDRKDAAVMASTYTEDAQVLTFIKGDKPGEIATDVKKGRSEIEDYYRDMFKDGGKSSAKNVVAFARSITPDVLVIEGTFQPDVAKLETYPFVQIRVRQGDAWLIKSLQIFAFSGD